MVPVSIQLYLLIYYLARYSRTTRPVTERKSWNFMICCSRVAPPNPIFFCETRRQCGSNVGSIMDGAWCMLEQQETFYFLKKKCMSVLWEGFDWVLPIFHKIKVILKSGSAAGIIEKSRECNAYAQLWDANSTALAQSYPASIGSGGAPSIEMWIIWDGKLLHYGLAGRSQNVLFNLYLIATKIEYKKINIFYSNPLPDLRPDLETSGYSAFAYMFGFVKFQRTMELWCLVVWSSQGLDYHTCICSIRPTTIEIPRCI